MKVEYARRAVADLLKIATDSAAFGPVISAGIESRLRDVVARIAENPEIGARIVDRPAVRVMPLIRYPYKIFYRLIDDDVVRILHIRHTARRPWKRAAQDL